MRRHALQRYLVFRMKLVELLHLLAIVEGLFKNQFTPANELQHTSVEFTDSAWLPAICWFAVIIDQHPDGLNVFKLWRELFPKDVERIDQVWNEIGPVWPFLVELRDRAGFHADAPRKFLRAKLSFDRNREKVAKALQSFVKLAVFFIGKEEEELPDFVEEAQRFLREMGAELECDINWDKFQRCWILPKEVSPPVA